MSHVRTREPVRTQATFGFELPDDALPMEHPARLLWKLIEGLNLDAFLKDRRAVEGCAGRDVLSVKMLLTLWLYAVSVNVGSAREIERRTRSDAGFKWIVGDQRVSRTTLAEFRVGHGDALDKVMTDVLAVLLQKKLVSLDLVAQDGTRVRASASAPSFRQWASLEECREHAALHLKAVLAESDGDPRARALREQKARDYAARVESAFVELQSMLDSGQGSDIVRASTTDPEARVMKMPDGGFRPAYNMQLATAGDPMGGARTIVGVRITNVGSDMGSVEPMLDEVERRTGQVPDVLLADAGHADVDSITAAAARGVRPLISVPKRSAANGPKANKSPAIAAWRDDMQSDEAKQLLRARASLCELPNAHAKTRFAMSSLLVRGLGNVTCVALLFAITHNLLGHARALLG
jgi:transposase